MKYTNNIAIEMKHVTKEYVVHHEKPTLVESCIREKTELFTALRDVNLTIRKGERVGIIGPNGSGKTTLLKIIAGITSPTKGDVTVRGKLVSLIDLNAGFHADLTGYQNIFLNALFLGMSKISIQAVLPKIIKYADINQFIDAPLYTYSSGMTLRLGFAIAVHTDPDILILDENMSVGDRDFQKKATYTINQLMKRNITVIFASHDLNRIKQLCTKIIYLDKGTVTVGSIQLLDSYKRKKLY